MNIKLLGWETVFLECSFFGDIHAGRTEIIKTNEDCPTSKKTSRPPPPTKHTHPLTM